MTERCGTCGMPKKSAIHYQLLDGVIQENSHPFESNDYVAYLCFDRGRLRLCDSDADGAFRVYRSHHIHDAVREWMDIAHDNALKGQEAYELLRKQRVKFEVFDQSVAIEVSKLRQEITRLQDQLVGHGFCARCVHDKSAHDLDSCGWTECRIRGCDCPRFEEQK